MSVVLLNTVALDDGIIIKKGSGSGGGNTPTPTPSRPKWTGHADAEGLRAIGWTDEDIAYYQENGVNWNEEDDEYHKVSDDNKALYGVLTANNISTYASRIVYLPKIDTSGRYSLNALFKRCTSLIAVPFFDTSRADILKDIFADCLNLVCVPQLDTSNATTIESMFSGCISLEKAPIINASKVSSLYNLFNGCYSLRECSLINANNIRNTIYAFGECHSLKTINGEINISSSTNNNVIIYNSKCVRTIKLKGLSANINLQSEGLFKESLLYLINNEAATSAITIKLASYAYTRLSNDADIVAALTAHPNISISQ